MPPAARVTDSTTHGSPLAPGPGSVNVLIGNLPAWRAMIDQHACPAVSISGADGVGSVMMGSPTVLINNQMACRLGDIVIEKPGLALGPVNPIIMGEMTVMIGEVGGPGGTSIGGLAVVPLPNGDLKVGSNIVIKKDPTDPAFQMLAIRDLAIMSTHPTGRNRIKSIESAKHTVIIKHGRNNETNPAKGHNLDAAAKGKPAWGGGTGTGKGTDCTIQYDPRREPPTNANPKVRRPADVALHHEMTHADHMVHGREDASPDPAHPNNPNLEETNVIDQDNQYRDERGIPRRRDHTVL